VQPETVLLHDATRPSWTGSGPRPIRARIWPSRREGPAATVLLSHGTGGAGEDLDWLAAPLNEAGFLVASVDHHGNSYNDEYLVEGFTLVSERPRDISYLLDHVQSQCDVDERRIGSAGFSLGGYTVAALLGAQIDTRVMSALFAGHVPAPHVPEFPDLMEALRAKYSIEQLELLAQAAARPVRDLRVRAGALFAPGIAEVLTPASLRMIEAPVLVRWGDLDDITPPAENARVYADLMPRAEAASVGATAGHYVFLGDREDPSHVREAAAADTVDFFTRHL